MGRAVPSMRQLIPAVRTCSRDVGTGQIVKCMTCKILWAVFVPGLVALALLD